MKKTDKQLWRNLAWKNLSLILLCFGLLCYGESAWAATRNVPGSYPTIQAGIDAAVDGDMVLVDDGIYTENVNFNGKEISVKSKNGAASTTIDGNANGSVVTFKKGEGPESVLDGFTIINGSGTASGNYTYGGGIYCSSSSPTITNCIIKSNSITGTWGGYGSGIYCSVSSPTGNRSRGI